MTQSYARARLRSKTTRPFKMTPVGFEPTQLALVEFESTPLDHSGKVSLNNVPLHPTRAALQKSDVPDVSAETLRTITTRFSIPLPSSILPQLLEKRCHRQSRSCGRVRLRMRVCAFVCVCVCVCVCVYCGNWVRQSVTCFKIHSFGDLFHHLLQIFRNPWTK
jgi:hypothetical protein